MAKEAADPLRRDVLVEILDLEEEYSFRNLFRINKALLRFKRFDGQMSDTITRINFERGDSVGVLLYDPAEDMVVLTRQFRYPVYASIAPENLEKRGGKKAWMLETVAGIIDPGYSTADIASKEILEEAGYVIQGDLQPIITIYPSPGGTSERIHLFLGLIDHKDRLTEMAKPVSHGEDIQVVKLSFQEALLKIDQGEISDAKTIIALQHLALFRLSGGDLK